MLNVYNSLSTTSPSVFRSAQVSHENEFTTDIDIVAFLKPTDILVSKWYPGYRVSDLSGRFADEAIGIMLADTLRTVESLSTFQKLLATPDIATDVFTTLLPRAGVPVKNRKYLMSEPFIASVVRDKLTARGFDQAAARLAYTHACTRVLHGLGLVQPGIERQSVNLATSFAITVLDIKRVVLTEALRDLMSEARLNIVARELGEESTPQIIGETVGRMFRNISHVMPEVKLRLEQLEIVINTIVLYHTARDRVPNAIQAHPALVTLASYANFIMFAEGRIPDSDLMPAADVTTVREACNNVLTVLQSAPSIESMSLTSYAEYFGEVPAASPDGIRRGLVLYTCGSQTSRMDVADVYPNASGSEMSAVAGEYVKVTAVAPAITASLLSTDAVTGLVNIMADELAMSSPPAEDGCFSSPTLMMLNVTEQDMIYVALAKAEAVAFVQDTGRGPVRLLYGCTVAEQWRMTVFAASPAMAYFTDPHAVIVYRSNMRAVEPRTLPARAQTIGILPGRDVQFVGDIQDYLIDGLEKPFSLKLPIQSYNGEEIVLDLQILVLSSLLGEDSENYSSRGGAYYAAVREPGVDAELVNIFDCALAYARDGGNILSDRAKSWLIERLAPAMLHPAIQGMAQRAINKAVIAQQLDARALAPQFKEIIVRAYVGTLLAVLTRFNKLKATTAVSLTQVLPVSGLTIKSQLTMASIPTALNANFNKD